ncbi:MAG TPA: endonuclease III [Vicinamibacteria bacterium]|nr:endonuclease III [Vicinamibacteria bacterium]
MPPRTARDRKRTAVRARKPMVAFRPGLHRARANKILDVLAETHPDATCALHYRGPYELVAATILSAQCTDERVNAVTPALFARYPTAADLARARPADVEEIVRSTGFFRAKTKSLLGCARALVERHRGEVPRTMAEMVLLPGVGRKTASVVLGHVYGINEGIAVDTHVLRVGNRLAIAGSDDPLVVERQLMAMVPRARWTQTTDLLIFHGRRICQARRPRCGQCPVFALCRWPLRQAFALGRPPQGPRATAKARPRVAASRLARTR